VTGRPFREDLNERRRIVVRDGVLRDVPFMIGSVFWVREVK